MALLQIQVQRTSLSHMCWIREAFRRQHCPPAGALAYSSLRTVSAPWRPMSARSPAFTQRTAFAICGDVARDRHPLHEPVPPHGLSAISAPRHRDDSRCVPGVVAAKRVSAVFQLSRPESQAGGGPPTTGGFRLICECAPGPPAL